MRDAFCGVQGECQAAGRLVVLQHIAQAGLIDRAFTALESFNLVRVDIDAKHIVADLREAGAGDQTHIAGAVNCDLHGVKLPIFCVAVRFCRVCRG